MQAGPGLGQFDAQFACHPTRLVEIPANPLGVFPLQSLAVDEIPHQAIVGREARALKVELCTAFPLSQ